MAGKIKKKEKRGKKKIVKLKGVFRMLTNFDGFFSKVFIKPVNLFQRWLVSKRKCHQHWIATQKFVDTPPYKSDQYARHHSSTFISQILCIYLIHFRSVWKSLNKSHFTTLRSKRATLIFDFSSKNSTLLKKKIFAYFLAWKWNETFFDNFQTLCKEHWQVFKN